MTDNALKAISRTDDELRVGNYIVLFGGRDLEGVANDNKNLDGSAGEFFTPNTVLDSSYTKAGALYVDWEHGQGDLGDELLGVVDWKTARVDDQGVFVERVLNRRNQYVQWVEGLIEAGLVGTSSEAEPEGVQKADNGAIERWPLKRDTLTVAPMEPRMLTENTVTALKALGISVPTDTPAPEATPEADQSAAVAAKATNTGTITETITEDIMSEEQTQTAPELDVAAIVAEAAEKAAESAVKAYRAQLEAEPPTNSGIVVVEDEADKAIKARPYKGLGDFLADVIKAGAGDYDPRLLPLRSKDALDEGAFSLNGALGDDYVGSITKSAHARKAVGTGLAEGIGSTGGFLVGTDTQSGILARVYDSGQLLQRVGMDGLSAGSNAMTYNVEAETSRADGSRRGGIRAYWAAEAGSYTASYPTFRQVELKLKKVVGLVYATDEQIQDTSALESYISRILPEELRFVVEDSIINGSGGGQMKGILATGATVSVDKETGQAAATIVSQNIMKMWARMYGPSRRNAVWLIEQSCEPQLMQLSLSVGTGGVPLYTPAGGLSAAPYATIFNRPVLAHESCKAVGTVGDIILMDPQEYQMIEKGGIQSASSIHVAFTTGEQLFRFTYRCDGSPLWASALTPLSAGDTLSPYITLATRA
jgi:HK97 family phage major capsid protein